MRRLRYSLLLLIMIVGVFLNIERVDIGSEADIINLNTFVYLLAFVAVFSVLLLPDRMRPSSIIMISFWIVVYLFLRLTIFNERVLLGGIYTYLTVTELAMISLLVLATSRVANDLYEVEDSVATATLEDVSDRVKHMEQADELITKEFARSRRYDTPISVMVLKVHPEDVQFNMQRAAEEILQGMLKRYASNRLVRLLDRELRRSDLVLERMKEDEIVLVLPETTPEGTDILADRIRSAIKKNMGISITAGYASFPDEALTFDDLLKQAQAHAITPQIEGETEGHTKPPA
ncbi:MAG: diguanylate cyclase [Anaerolineales bacterium]|nr:diguanylate cyclase [Chloroflexota bacterium]MBL6982387.1 diguanylate cyclase [Anaerolineales bacterium]